jgi:hypothetical protein
MGIFLECKNAQDIVVFMKRLAKVSPFLLVPPGMVWISELTL